MDTKGGHDERNGYCLDEHTCAHDAQKNRPKTLNMRRRLWTWTLKSPVIDSERHRKGVSGDGFDLSVF
jgi:hypothetical protein